jgi:hypothetical protein
VRAAQLSVAALATLLTVGGARADRTAVAVTSLHERGLAGKEADRLELLLIAAIQGTGLAVANRDGDRLAITHHAGADFSDDPAARALALGRQLGAPLALAVDAASLGDGTVLYLQGVDVAAGRPIDSTTFSLDRDPDLAALRGALVRVVAPDRWRATLEVHVDVAGAQLLVDGAPATVPIALTCGTHSLRVTHPAYRDFLHFVTLDYGKTTTVEVALSRYPVDEGELRARDAARKPLLPQPTLLPQPWYRSGWLLGAASVLLFGAATALTATFARGSVAADQRTTCCN